MVRKEGIVILDDGSIFREVPVSSNRKIKVNNRNVLVEHFIGEVIMGEKIAKVGFKDFNRDNLSLDNLEFVTESEMQNMSLDTLKKLIHYDRNTGRFFKKYASKGHGPRETIDSRGPKGYLEIRITHNGKIVFRKLAHVVAFAFEYGYWPDSIIDHINRDKRDNRIENLREVSYIQNALNTNPIGSDGLPKGIKKTKNGKFAVSINHNYVSQHIGTFDTLEEAKAGLNQAKLSSPS